MILLLQLLRCTEAHATPPNIKGNWLEVIGKTGFFFSFVDVRFSFLYWIEYSLSSVSPLSLPSHSLPYHGLIFFQHFMWVFGIWINVLKSILVQQAIYLLCHFFNPHLISLNIFFFLALFNGFLFTRSVYFRCNLLSGHLLVSSLLSHTLCLIRLSLSSLSQFVCYPQSPSPAAPYSRSEISCIKNWNSQLPIISTQ